MRLGLPEWDDRLEVWRVALISETDDTSTLGEVRVVNGVVVWNSDLALVGERRRSLRPVERPRDQASISFAQLPSTLFLGDARDVAAELPAGAVQLVFTSPPYFNAKPDAHESLNYERYLALLRDVFTKCHMALSEGRFLVVNTSPVLIRRPHRQAASRRIPITYDLHPILDAIGFDFIDDIIWQKPEGAGWHLGRGRRFAADRQPLQYKAVTVTENVTVYRKRTKRLIDWNLRQHPDRTAVEASRIADGYERTNIWRLGPAHHSKHPCVFPESLAERVIRYYSFIGDMVLDPFAGTGTTGRVAARLGRRFALIERAPGYFAIQTADPEVMGSGPRVNDSTFFASTL